jgi:dTMP kinase
VRDWREQVSEDAGLGGFSDNIDDVKSEFKLLVRNGNFMKLFWGQLISSSGDWLTTLALISLVYGLTGSSLAVGGMVAFRVVPALFSGPIAAHITDRVDRRKLMIGCDISRGIVILLAPFMTRVWAVYVLVFFLEGISIVWLAARDASIPNLVDKEQLTMANSLSMATTYGVIPLAAILFSLITVPSPLTKLFIDGGFFAEHPTALAFFIDALTFFIAAVFFYRMHLLSPKDHLDMEQTPKFAESLTYAIRHPFTRSLMLGVAVGCMGGGSLYAVGIGYVKEVIGAQSDAAFGLLMALFGLGMIAGVVALQVLVHREEKPWMLRMSLLVLGGIMIGMSFVHVAALAYVLAGFFGAAFGILFVIAVTMMQERVEDADRGKAFAAFHVVSRIFLVVGAGVAGAIAGIFDVHTLNVFGISYTVYGISVALFVAGVLIASVSVVPLGDKKERVRDYFAREKPDSVPKSSDA